MKKNNLVIALSTKPSSYPERLEWIAQHQFAAEYTPDPQALSQIPEHLNPLLQSGIPVRYHAFFPKYEIGHQDAVQAKQALLFYESIFEAIQGLGEQVMTFHIGLDSRIPLDAERAKDNLARLADLAREKGIILSLENLRKGITSNPETVLAWSKNAGIPITLDIGHAASSVYTQENKLCVLDYVEYFGDRLIEAHVYEKETDRHYPPEDMSMLGPVLERLLDMNCRWWTIELEDYGEALATRNMITDTILKTEPALQD
ncbi:MAG: sugar phosphate isomerase/epimerase [Anaerolineales bacterium]|nr:sugar phosphate isomerase/epimerase [Anaerolineales bacterium]